MQKKLFYSYKLQELKSSRVPSTWQFIHLVYMTFCMWNLRSLKIKYSRLKELNNILIGLNMLYVRSKCHNLIISHNCAIQHQKSNNLSYLIHQLHCLLKWLAYYNITFALFSVLFLPSDSICFSSVYPFTFSCVHSSLFFDFQVDVLHLE